MILMRQAAILISLLLTAGANTFGQKEKPVPTCRQSTFAAFKALPKLEYDCPEGLTESDDKILKLPERAEAIREIVKALGGFSNPAWWQAPVDELNACQVHGSVGPLNAEEKEKWTQGDYGFSLAGDHELRLVLLDDPCYQPGYNGANVFLLYRQDGKVFVSQVLNGYYSRVDNSVGLDFARSNGKLIIEISTANSMPPSYLYHYFEIDPKTNKALPIALFNDMGHLRNEIYSAMLLSEPADLGLPRNAGELKVINAHRLAPSFSAYEEDERGKIDSNGRHLRRIVYRWHGRFYVRTRG